jgi:hypothetical protein
MGAGIPHAVPYEPLLERRRVSNPVWAPWLVSAPLGSPRLVYHQRSAVARPPLGSARFAYHHRSASRLEETSVDRGLEACILISDVFASIAAAAALPPPPLCPL